MRTKELKAFLQSRGVRVDDCFDAEALMARAAATKDQWAETPAASAAAQYAAGASAVPDAAEIEKAWEKLCAVWPGGDPLEFGPPNADKSVILLHGFGDTNAKYLSETFSLLQRIEGLRLLLPQAPEEQLQGQRLQSWFLPTKGQWVLDDSVAQPSVAYLHAMVRREIGRGVQPHRIVLGGFAQGGGVALRAALGFPDATLGGGLALSTFFGAAEATVAPVNQNLNVLVCHGRDDEIVPFSEGERAAQLLGRLVRRDVEFKAYDMKHGVASDEMTDVFEFLVARLEATPDPPVEATPEPSLAFDPAGLTEESPQTEPEPLAADRFADTGKGVPSMEPEMTLKLMNDPEVIEAVKDPELMAVIQDVIMFPEHLEDHRGNPRASTLVRKLDELMGGMELTALEAPAADAQQRESGRGAKSKVRVPIRGGSLKKTIPLVD